MLRPSTSRGLPAFGCADSCSVVTAAIRSIVSSIGAGPTAQLTPMIVAPRRLELRREPLRRRAVERVAVLLGRHLRDDRQIRHAAHRVDRRADLVQIAERLEDEQIDAAVGERLRLLAEVRRAPRRRRSCPTARCGRRADRSRRRRRPDRRAACRAIFAPLRVDRRAACRRVPNDPSLIRLAPNVFVSMMSAPARTYSWCTSRDEVGLR